MDRVVVPQWQPAPQAPGLAAGRVDIWRIDLDAPQSGLARDAALEQAADRAGAAPTGTRRVAHFAMRDILSRYLGRPADRLTIGRRPGGKPFVDLPECPIEFNLSHTRGVALLAVGVGCGIGIDVEVERRIDDPLRLARRALATGEAARLARLPAAQRVRRFLDLWTHMEARQKALGRGIFAAAADAGRMSTVGFLPDGNLFAALAVTPRQPGLRLRFFDYGRS